MAETTHPIKVDEETWRELNARKRPGDSFDDVLCDLLEKRESTDA